MTKANGGATLARPVRQELIFSTNVGVYISLTYCVSPEIIPSRTICSKASFGEKLI